jgi:hypothetical protein
MGFLLLVDGSHPSRVLIDDDLINEEIILGENLGLEIRGRSHHSDFSN